MRNILKIRRAVNLSFYCSVMLIVALMGSGKEAYAVDWQIDSYMPQSVYEGYSNTTVTINGTFSIYPESYKINIKKENTSVDITGHVIAWTQGQVMLLLPTGIGAGVYKFAVYTSGDTLLAEGPEFTVKDKPHLMPGPGGTSKPPIKVDAKGLLKSKPSELEIKNITGLPLQVCPDKNYTINVTIMNHGDWQTKYHLCSVGSLTHRCDLGQPQVHSIQGKSMRTHSMILRPASPFIENGLWHGKVFLGKVKSESDNSKITVQGSDNQTTGSSECNVGVSSSWKDGVGLSAGALFCDNNMDNHLVKFEVDSDLQQCKPILKKTTIQGTNSNKQPSLHKKEIIKKPDVPLKKKKRGFHISPLNE